MCSSSQIQPRWKSGNWIFPSPISWRRVPRDSFVLWKVVSLLMIHFSQVLSNLQIVVRCSLLLPSGNVKSWMVFRLSVDSKRNQYGGQELLFWPLAGTASLCPAWAGWLVCLALFLSASFPRFYIDSQVGDHHKLISVFSCYLNGLLSWQFL